MRSAINLRCSRLCILRSKSRSYFYFYFYKGIFGQQINATMKLSICNLIGELLPRIFFEF